MERPFGSSERVSKSDPFSSNNRLSISRTFPGTPPNNHILPFPDVLAQTPRFNYPLIWLRSAALAPSRTGIPFNKPPTPSALLSRHSAGRSSALMTSRFLTIEITSAGQGVSDSQSNKHIGPPPWSSSCPSSSKPTAPRRRSTNKYDNVREINKKQKNSVLLCLVESPLTSCACPSFLYALIKARLWPPSTRRLERLNHLRHIPIPAQVSRYLFICKKDSIPANPR